ncbi:MULTISPECIES: hypothetical protein [Bacteroidales]|jgi:hypothetical protein|uniref:hypothetical protein n=1 Tax=Bacteroidales TaxID=171549 RepID=UPI002570E210|nr:hypothetical protein [Bacteroides acidifaciens]
MEGKRPFVTKKRCEGEGQIERQLGPEIGIPNKVLTYTSFPKGYFDQDGAPHYYISDYQCNHAYGYILPATQSKKYIQSLHSNIQPDEIIPCVIENTVRTSLGDPVRMSYQTIQSSGQRQIDKRQLLFYTSHDYKIASKLNHNLELK